MENPCECFWPYPNIQISTDAPVTMPISASSSSNGCPKCGIKKKSGALSCCARGGAWFNNCGTDGDPSYNHTWTEGVEACKGFASSILVKPLSEVMLGHVGDVLHPMNTTRSRNVVQKHKHIPPPLSMPNEGTRIDKVPAFVCVFFISLFRVWTTYSFLLLPT